MGKCSWILEPSLNFLMIFLDCIGYAQSLKELAIDVLKQSAVIGGQFKIKFNAFLYLNKI